MYRDVDLNSWAEIDDVVIKYDVSPVDGTVEFTFGHKQSLTINLTERALARCVEQFPEALTELRTRSMREPSQ
ncbi:hypothetical protein KIPE111705_35630 [Kibdelosporangium persicum]|uniref:Uncharacterized protein n=1 Tax=Kibdelosporangium persicum TaxID=2698649 RepID=A0ABX2FDS0_9PSEU|nr:hypothetical protein [Kibdelosporangium persicum]NRN69062.1 hypothetical protein [Kibdelosporangium persicum]